MPEIIVTALGATTSEVGEINVTLRERLNAADFDSERFAANLVERIEWAVSDAVDMERRGRITGRVRPPRHTHDPNPEPEPELVGA